ncbi:hypothetical protein [Bradyrhizobium sp. USDA 313]|uniref:hypothetical protein n=1 Tax=Bradyrhizobium sp. USDA 313 TaxID=3156307 RepID=UPI0035198377
MRSLILLLTSLVTSARAIRFDLHGSSCCGFGVQACWRAKAIAATAFAFRLP